MWTSVQPLTLIHAGSEAPQPDQHHYVSGGNRLQVVRIGDSTSSSMILNTGTLQGCVLSPALFTHECTAIHSSNMAMKFAGDTTVVGLISDNDETHYREEVQHLTQWCSSNNLILNTSKTKEVIVDNRKLNTLPLHTGGGSGMCPGNI